MFYYYKVDGQRIQEATKEDHNWLIIQDSTEEERGKVLKKYRLPADIYIGTDEPEEVSRIERLWDTNLKNPISLILVDLGANKEEHVEKRLEPISFILSEDLLITYIAKDSQLLDHLIEKHPDVKNFNELIAYSLLMIYTHYIMDLKRLKKRIDHLDASARNTTENKELFRLADTERDVVYLDHTLKDQDTTVREFFEYEDFWQKLDNEALIYDIKLRQRYANKMVNIYRDLLETIGGLFSDMMDNNLNHLMKYLDSAALVVAIPAMVGGLWGINTGGLPGKDSPLGSLIVLGLAIGLAVIAGIHLYRKDFTR